MCIGFKYKEVAKGYARLNLGLLQRASISFNVYLFRNSSVQGIIYSPARHAVQLFF